MSIIEIEKSEYPMRTIGIDIYIDVANPFLVISIIYYNIFIGRVLNCNNYVKNKR